MPDATHLRPRPAEHAPAEVTTIEFGPAHEYTPDEAEFVKAMDRFRRESRRSHPTWVEILGVVRSLGYRKPDGAST